MYLFLHYLYYLIIITFISWVFSRTFVSSQNCPGSITTWNHTLHYGHTLILIRTHWAEEDKIQCRLGCMSFSSAHNMESMFSRRKCRILVVLQNCNKNAILNQKCMPAREPQRATEILPGSLWVSLNLSGTLWLSLALHSSHKALA